MLSRERFPSESKNSLNSRTNIRLNSYQFMNGVALSLGLCIIYKVWVNFDVAID